MRLRNIAFLLVACVVAASAIPDKTVAQRLYRSDSQNFAVFAPDPAFAKRIGSEAERFRKELAIEWLGQELPQWKEKCPIRVSLSPHSGGETSFAFLSDGRQRAEPTGWDMKVFGTPERILDSVLPHEVTHTIFATHFRRPLPRWADEGACTTVEHQAEKQKNHHMLVSFLSASPSRGIPFNRMFTMRDYPPDILPLYAQGFSVAKFLIMQKGRRPFLEYIETGMNLERPGQETLAWDRATQQHYGYKDLSELQVRWQRWVAEGSRINPVVPEQQPVERFANANVQSLNRPAAPTDNLQNVNQGWYARQMKAGPRTKAFFSPADESDPKSKAKPKAKPNAKPKTIWR